MQSVSVAVLSYRPNMEKMWITLTSILLQKDVDVEIIIADDGSAENHFDEIRAFFAGAGFTNYKLVENPVNRGTVWNYISAVRQCSHDLVKPLSPGDLLYDENTLSRWAQTMKENAAFSVAQAVYYHRENGIWESVPHKCQPMELGLYENFEKNRETIVRNYLLSRDWCLGSAVMVNREKLLSYLDMIADKVIYTEDTIFSLMLAQGETGTCFRENGVLYEYGTGISTCGNQAWQEKVDKDRAAANALVLETMTLEGALRRDVQRLFRAAEIGGIQKKLANLLTKGRLRFKYREIFAPKWADMQLPEEFLAQIGQRLAPNAKED